MGITSVEGISTYPSNLKVITVVIEIKYCRLALLITKFLSQNKKTNLLEIFYINYQKISNWKTAINLNL